MKHIRKHFNLFFCVNFVIDLISFVFVKMIILSSNLLTLRGVTNNYLKTS